MNNEGLTRTSDVIEDPTLDTETPLRVNVDVLKQRLIEQKRKITKIYDGYIFQIYAQYFCLTEMNFKVNNLKLYSKEDNRSYKIALPCQDSIMFKKFKQLIANIHSFKISDTIETNINKCRKCVYNLLCDEDI